MRADNSRHLAKAARSRVRFPPDRGGIGYKESHAREEAQV